MYSKKGDALTLSYDYNYNFSNLPRLLVVHRCFIQGQLNRNPIITLHSVISLVNANNAAFYYYISLNYIEKSSAAAYCVLLECGVANPSARSW